MHLKLSIFNGNKTLKCSFIDLSRQFLKPSKVIAIFGKKEIFLGSETHLFFFSFNFRPEPFFRRQSVKVKILVFSGLSILKIKRQLIRGKIFI